MAELFTCQGFVSVLKKVDVEEGWGMEDCITFIWHIQAISFYTSFFIDSRLAGGM